MMALQLNSSERPANRNQLPFNKRGQTFPTLIWNTVIYRNGRQHHSHY